MLISPIPSTRRLLDFSRESLDLTHFFPQASWKPLKVAVMFLRVSRRTCLARVLLSLFLAHSATALPQLGLDVGLTVLPGILSPTTCSDGAGNTYTNGSNIASGGRDSRSFVESTSYSSSSQHT